MDNESFRCVCNLGFQEFYNGAQVVCNDINECQSGQHECDYNAQCLNNIGSYVCQCNPGFEGDGFACETARSCENITCPENAECVESNGVAECKCSKGFSGNITLHLKTYFTYSYVGLESIRNSQKFFFRGNGKHCTPILDHSCHNGNNCSPYGYCAISPTTQSYYCACLPGYTGDGYTCTILDITTTTAVVEVTQLTTEPARK